MDSATNLTKGFRNRVTLKRNRVTKKSNRVTLTIYSDTKQNSCTVPLKIFEKQKKDRLSGHYFSTKCLKKLPSWVF